MASGDPDAAQLLFPLVQGELRAVARRLMRGERRNHTLQTTALVHEAWLRVAPSSASPESRAQFLRIAAESMRRVLIDHARRRAARKRSGGRRHDLFDAMLERWDRDATDLIALDAALDRLGALDEDLRRLVELRFFAGLTLEETGAVLGMTVRQVHRRWTFARGWLRCELSEEGREDG